MPTLIPKPQRDLWFELNWKTKTKSGDVFILKSCSWLGVACSDIFHAGVGHDRLRRAQKIDQLTNLCRAATRCVNPVRRESSAPIYPENHGPVFIVAVKRWPLKSRGRTISLNAPGYGYTVWVACAPRARA